MSNLLDGRVAIVTGAGRGIGRAHALELARHGAAVVVNDFGVSISGEGTGETPAEQVVAEIEAAGGRAVVNTADVADFAQAEAKEGRQRAARVINTSSGAGLQGSVGQATYSAAKAGIAALTLVAAQELGRYGVTVNAIAPVARTRMTEGAFDTSAMALPEDNSPIVAWLASAEAEDVTGRVIEIDGSTMTVETGWRHGPARDLGRRWEAAEVGPALRELLGQGPAPEPVYGA